MGFLHDRGFYSKSEKALGTILITIIVLSVIMTVACFALILSNPLGQIIFAIFCIPAILAFIFMKDTNCKEERDETTECVMCDRPLKKEHESKTWKGSHEWCDDCY